MTGTPSALHHSHHPGEIGRGPAKCVGRCNLLRTQSTFSKLQAGGWGNKEWIKVQQLLKFGEYEKILWNKTKISK